MKRKFVFFFLLAVLAAVPVMAYGATFKAGQSFYLEPGATLNDNLYTAGANVNVKGAINGDLLAAGGNILMSGAISGDIAAAGGSLDVSSKVGGSVRIAGGNLNISNSVAGDLIAVGGQISILPGSEVGKDAALAGGTVYINGTINGNLQVAGGDIKLGPNAMVKGTFDYYSQSPVVIDQGAVVNGAINFHRVNASAKAAVGKGFLWGIMGFFALIKLIMIFVAALVMLYCFKNQTKAIVEKSVLKFWPEALRGFIILVVVPIAVILSFITVLGASLGIIVALFYGLFVAISSIISILLFARLSLKYIFSKKDYNLNWWIVLIASLVLWLIALIPFVGWILVFVIFISALGSTADFIYKKLKT